MKNGLILPCNSEACSHYRLSQPLAAYAHFSKARIARSSNGCGNINEFRKHGFDAVFSQREPGHGEYQIKWRKEFPDTPMIYDFDDLLWKPHLKSTFKPSPEYLHGINQQVSVASAITVSTKEMGEEVFARYGRESIVVPNLIGKQAFKAIRKRPAKMRVLWSGSKTHRPDLGQIIPVVIETKDRYDWFFMGDVPDTLKGIVTASQHVPFAQYLATMHGIGADVAIAPLTDHRFNECKSNLKLLEYGALGMATIATDYGPYRNSRADLVSVNDTEGWLRALRNLEKDTAWKKNVTNSQAYAERFRVDKNIPLLRRQYDKALSIKYAETP